MLVPRLKKTQRERKYGPEMWWNEQEEREEQIECEVQQEWEVV